MKRVRGRSAALAVAVLALGVAVLAGRAPEASSAAAKLPPLAWTMPAEDVTNTEALLFGRFNPRGSRTVIQFQYGQTKKYGHVTPPYPEEEWFGNEVNVEEEIAEELCQGTVYHFRIAAKSKVGTGYGKDRTFKTRGRAKNPPGHCAR
jgi:hypothetical protein